MAGKSVLLLEKGLWPRDKICGDAVGGKSLGHVKALGVKETLESTPHFRVTGIKFSSPKGNTVRVALPEEDVQRLEAGYSLPRMQFDHLLFDRCQELVRENGGKVIQDCAVTEVLFDDGSGGEDPGQGTGSQRHAKGVVVKIGGRNGEEKTYFSTEIVGAAGYQCPVAKAVVKESFSEEMVDNMHYCGGYREYWRNVKGCEGGVGDIEIHFVDSVVPGYFWIFPVNDEVANVGIGMVIGLLKKEKKKLKALQKDVIENHPLFKERFANSEMIEGSGKGWQLPFGSPRKKEKNQPRRASMNGIRLVGDSASLVDPFSGEGVGNALVTGELAANHIIAGKSPEEKSELGVNGVVATLVFARFAIAALMMLIFFKKARASLNNKQIWQDGLILGVLMFIAYLSQMIGLDDIDPSVSAFLTSLYVVFTAIIASAYNLRLPTKVMMLILLQGPF